jgi:hypothetical protein
MSIFPVYSRFFFCEAASQYYMGFERKINLQLRATVGCHPIQTSHRRGKRGEEADELDMGRHIYVKK